MGLSLKSLLPAVGAAVGLAIPGGSAITAALGSGIGTLVGGGDPKDAIKNALLAGGTAKLFPGIGEGIQGLAGTAPSAAGQAVASEAAGQAAAQTVAQEAGKKAVEDVAQKSFLDSLMSPTGLAVSGGLAALLASSEPEGAQLTDLQRRQLETGERVPDYEGRAGPVFVDPNTGEYLYDSSARREALDMLRERENEMIRRRNEGLPALAQGGLIPSFNMGGFVEGPGTGTSDDIKAQIYQNGVPVQEARLSDEEFVFTKKAVKGAGNGDTDKGAAKMYAMMKQFERMA